MINTTEFNTRLKKILDYYSLSASAFSETITVQRSSISHILSGRNKPSLEFITKVLKAFPEIDLIWLLSGVGEFLSTTTTPPQIEVPKTTPLNPISASPKETALIERIVIFYRNGSCKNYEMNTSK
jgi:transcriptional regulator with XRE-family HTH domain